MIILPPPLLRKIIRVQSLAQKKGLFLNDRELLHCRHCGLLEDVKYTGLLITYKAGDDVSDTGLRFEQDKEGGYICPFCGSRVEKERRVRAD